MATKKGAAAAEAPAFEKKQLAACQDFREQTDLVNALLEDGKLYTKDEAKRLVNKFLKGPVK